MRDLAQTFARKTLQGREECPARSAEHCAESMGGSRPLTIEGIRGRATPGAGAQSLLLENGHKRESAALPRRIGFSFCAERGCAGFAVSVRRNRRDQPAGRGKLFRTLAAAKGLHDGRCRTRVGVQLSFL